MIRSEEYVSSRSRSSSASEYEHSVLVSSWSDQDETQEGDEEDEEDEEDSQGNRQNIILAVINEKET